MCWLPIDQPLPLPDDSMICAQGPSPCSGTQSLASRLRRIGDEMDKNWTKATPIGARHYKGKASNRWCLQDPEEETEKAVRIFALRKWMPPSQPATERRGPMCTLTCHHDQHATHAARPLRTGF
ncbi:hypothetical protein J4Q44_G00229630 [Coregonus suidteri]|uniref:Uncharacterized protein n=1 Tax=Coregonus suidteri TaxID=861788 RepID=A0AAN8LAF3_9TELE